MMQEVELPDLLKDVKTEEKSYNWIKAADLCQVVLEKLSDEVKESFSGEIYIKMGNAYFRATGGVESSTEYINYINDAISAYQKGENAFKQLNNPAREIECRAQIYYLKGFIQTNPEESSIVMEKAYDLFIKSSKAYFEEDDQDGYSRTLARAVMALSFFVTSSSDNDKMKYLIRECRNKILKYWDTIRQSKNYQSMAEFVLAEHLIGILETLIFDFQKDEHWKDYLEDAISRGNDFLKDFNKCEDALYNGMLYSTFGSWHGLYGIEFIDDDKKQREIIDKSIKYLEKGLKFALDAGDKEILLFSLFYIDWWAFFGGKIEYLQKRVFIDLRLVRRIRKKYRNLFNRWHWYASILPANYYTNFAQRSFFTNAQRQYYAEKGISYAKEILKISSYLPGSVLSYEALTWAYSLLVNLASKNEEKDRYARKMLKAAKEAGNIAENYEGGLVRAAGYSCLSIAHRTLARIANKDEERIENLEAAITYSKKYINHAVESRTGGISAQVRLGLLYEEVGIITGNEEPLQEAKAIFQDLIDECKERGIHSYEASNHEYIARIENRLGNHVFAAEHYNSAHEAYLKSMRKIGYKPLKKRVNEKINYIKAWTFIEKAKSHHRSENHIKAKEFYEKAQVILSSLKRYEYEAPYYSGWIYLEEAEQLSKNENHEEAIRAFEDTKKSFEASIEILNKSLSDVKNETEKERIRKLIQVAKVRMNNCTARINLEEARILGKKGKHLEAADYFALAASRFQEICEIYKIKREKEELNAVYYLCHAWECMELAEEYIDTIKFSEAASLFMKASDNFHDHKMKLLASGNSTFCQALKLGCEFDESTEIKLKAELYPKIKITLRKAATLYKKGGFIKAADWALATSSYFDAAWYLIQADLEMSLEEKKKLLTMGSEILNSTADLFDKAGYNKKAEEVRDRLESIRMEQSILVSALITIQEPAISRSTTGIVAPACPIETSLSPRLSDVQQFTERDRKTRIMRIRSKYTSKINVFISYATEDSELYQIPRISKDLQRYPNIGEVKFWEKDLHDDIYVYMDRNIRLCDVMLSFCSKNALGSEAVQMEWQAALKTKKKIIPVFFNEEDIPPLISTKLGVQFSAESFIGTVEKIYRLILKKLRKN